MTATRQRWVREVQKLRTATGPTPAISLNASIPVPSGGWEENTSRKRNLPEINFFGSFSRFQ